MSKEAGKERLLAVAKLFMEETDEEVGLTTGAIIELLEENGISAERKAIYRDIAALRDAGMDIRKYERSPVEFALATRQFSHTELLLLVDAVQGSKFITKRQSDSLVKSIKTLGSKRQARGLDKRIFVGGRVKSQNDSVFRNVDVIQEAIAAKRKLRFFYASYDCAKQLKLRHNGQAYEQTPVQLLYVDGFYYLVCYSDKYDDFANYRVDRMCRIMVTESRAVRNARIATFDAEEYEQRVFGMFSGSSVSVSLLVEERVMNAVVDRFGKDVQVGDLGDGRARVSVPVMETPVFYGWVAQFNGQVVIEQPRQVRDRFAGYLRDMLAAYES